MARRCDVCGRETDDPVCPRCATILLPAEASCPRCGRPYEGPAASCRSCGMPTESPPDSIDAADAVHMLAVVPGIGLERAERLVSRGYRDFVDLVRPALPESDVRRGLHDTIARGALLGDLRSGPRGALDAGHCAVCGAEWAADADRCRTCGSSASAGADPVAVDRKLAEVAGELVGLSEDPDVLGMPSDLREDLLRSLGGVDSDAVLREEYRHQIEAWRDKGFEVEELERLLDADLAQFRERGAQMIRNQIRRSEAKPPRRCPLCEDELPRDADECENCGARLA